MAKWNKLVERIAALDKDFRFDEVRKVLEKMGYIGKFPKGGSSHCTFRKEGCIPITIPVHGPIGAVYVSLIRDELKREGLI